MSNLHFNHTPEEIELLGKQEKAKLLAVMDQVAATPATQASFENTLLKMEFAVAAFSNTLTPVMFLKYVSSDEKVRKAADVLETSVSQMFVDIFVREDLFKAILNASQKKEALTVEELRLFDETLTQFRRNGLELDSAKRKDFIEKKKRLVLLESEFNNNLAKETDFLAVTEKDLEGMPESYVKGLKKTEDGKFKISLDYPHYYPFMENAKNSNIRKALQFKFDRRGGDRNKALLQEAITIRKDLARMLGYPNHAAFVLERRMAMKPETVKLFLKDLSTKLKERGEKDLKELLEEKRKDLGDDQGKLFSWEWRYYVNKLKKNKYDLDAEKVKEYFPLETVLKGMFEIYETLFGVKFKQDKSASVWNEKVSKYAIEREGKAISYFYMDLFPRDGKYGHAAAFTLLGGYQKPEGSYELPVSSIVANFNPPLPGTPSLLTHGEVETLFHEFGHIMHQTLTRSRFATFSGTSVKTDFVEAPSQMLENWVWETEALQKISGHYQDPSKKLPEELISKMLKAKFLNVGLNYLRQVAFSTLDLEFHTAEEVETTQVYAKTVEDIMLIPIQEGTMPQASFGHLMGGYDSGYYGYLWSEVYAQDLYTRFEKEGLFNSKTGREYVKWILEPGGSQEPAELIKGFLGREPSSEAFLKSIGI